jgi:glycosyltransferase involved in cell wall biosynthesis
VVVLWAARLVPEKGADLFADAFVALFNNKTLLEHYPGVIDRIRIVVVGSGPSRAQMEAALPPDRTVFFGHLVGDELRAAYASSDVYFFPSHTEAFPNTLLEAQASGLAVLAPAYSVNRALVPAGSGHLVDEHAGPEEFADGLFTLLRDPRYRRAIGKEAVRVARNRTWAKAFDGLTTCYDRCKALRR